MSKTSVIFHLCCSCDLAGLPSLSMIYFIERVKMLEGEIQCRPSHSCQCHFSSCWDFQFVRSCQKSRELFELCIHPTHQLGPLGTQETSKSSAKCFMLDNTYPQNVSAVQGELHERNRGLSLWKAWTWISSAYIEFQIAQFSSTGPQALQ